MRRRKLIAEYYFKFYSTYIHHSHLHGLNLNDMFFYVFHIIHIKMVNTRSDKVKP